MPTYEYVCQNCGHEFDKWQNINAEPVRICPACGHMSVQRKISGGSGLIFKGSGFYITDYARKGKTASAPAANASQKTAAKKEKKAAAETPEEK